MTTKKSKAQQKRFQYGGKWYTPRGAELTRCSNTLTEAGFFSMIRNHARLLSVRWKPKNDYLISIRRPYTGTDKRTKYEYQCQMCLLWFVRKQIELDHIVECGALNCFEDIAGFYERLLCEIDGYQALCKPCHVTKTNSKRKI